MSGSVLQYCTCGTLYDYLTEEDSLILSCPNCGKRSEMSDGSDKVVLKISTNTSDSSIPTRHLKYDRTMMTTSKIPCEYKECPSNTDWVNNVPKMMLANYLDKDRRMKLICSWCSSVMNLAPTEDVAGAAVGTTVTAGAGAAVTAGAPAHAT